VLLNPVNLICYRHSIHSIPADGIVLTEPDGPARRITEMEIRAMASNDRVKRLLADGDPVTGMSDWAPVDDNIVEGEPMERRHVVYEGSRPGGGLLRAGVWEATPYTCRIVDYVCDEFCVVLEGSVTIIDDDGHEDTFQPGDTFLVPKGFTGYWKQTETFKKFFVTVRYG